MNKWISIFSALCLFFVIACKKESAKDLLVTTNNKNVFILKDSFAVLNQEKQPIHRKVWLYLPPDYDSSNKKYPVIYMHDGQNLFDDKSSFMGEWQVDESLSNLYQNTGKGFIVVGIENAGSERMNEYSPWKHNKYGGGNGDSYLEMIIHKLKPVVDKNFRTKANASNTAMIGSSMGGLISYYAGLKHPGVFGKVGALSTSFWFTEQVKAFTKQNGNQQKSRFYLLVGSKEGGSMETDMIAMKELLLSSGFDADNITSKIDPQAEHNEQFWKKEFKEVITWLFEI